MEQIYYYIGITVFWLSAGIGTIFTIGFMLKTFLNKLGEEMKTTWIIVEYAIYRKKFKEWLKGKKRIKK